MTALSAVSRFDVVSCGSSRIQMVIADDTSVLPERELGRSEAGPEPMDEGTAPVGSTGT
jgi:hypothetical protein